MDQTRTQKDIARKLGVSRQLVSLVLAGRRPPQNDVHRQILKLGTQTGYMPNSAALSLRRRKFRRIACVIMQQGKADEIRSTYTGYLNAISLELARRDYATIFEPFYLELYTDQFVEPPKLFTELAVDGVLCVEATGQVPAIVDERLDQIRAPVVWVNRNPTPGVETVVCDEFAHAQKLTRHLIELGHTRIAYLGPKSAHYSSEQRHQGVLQTLQNAGLDTSAVTVSPKGTWIHEVIPPLLDRKQRPTAVISYSLIGYIALMQAASRRRLRVPEDLSLCFFAKRWEVSPHIPTTAVMVPESQMGVRGVQRLLQIVEAKSNEPTQPILEGELTLGETTAAPGQT